MSESRPPSEAMRLDPFDFWRKVYEANEQTWSKAVKDMTSTHEYADLQGRMLETFLAFQKMVRDGMTMQMQALNMPTRDDVTRLGEMLRVIEEKVDELSDRLDGIESEVARGTGNGTPRPPRSGSQAAARAPRPSASRARPTPTTPGEASKS